MSDKALSDKRQAFVNEYEINGHNATQAYRTAYPGCKSGHRVNGCRLLTFDNVKQAIGKARAKAQAKTEVTVISVQTMYQTAYDSAQGLNQPSAMVSAVTGIARLYGMDKDNQVAADTPTPVSADQVDEFRAMARAATKLRLSS